MGTDIDYPTLLRLDGRGFVVLGAGQGMGRESARALVTAGARVVCVDAVQERAEAVAAELDAIPWVGDMTDRAAVEGLVEGAQTALGRLDGLIDVIGMSRYARIVDTDDAEWAWHQDIVLRHAWLSLQLFGRAMSETGGGTMAFVASASGLTGAPMHAAYGAAKAALMSLVRSAAVELGPSGIRVNAIAPGIVWTPRVAEYLGRPGRERNEANVPLGRVAVPSDIAAPLLFLSSDLSSYVNGQTILVDGGVGAKFPYPPPELAGNAA
jgi:NAD(P)-dependent dehydrogenase (short-subunit alcohol dehydrogenase family)